MKSIYFWIIAAGLLFAALATQTACTTASMTSPANTSNSGSGPATLSVSYASVSTSVSSTGYIYTSSSGSNGTGGVLSLTAHVGDTIMLPGSSFHPLYFDGGTSTCIYTGATSNQTYTFPAKGTYYFHCSAHAAGCTGAACGSTSCSAMAGVVTVS